MTSSHLSPPASYDKDHEGNKKTRQSYIFLFFFFPALSPLISSQVFKAPAFRYTKSNKDDCFFFDRTNTGWSEKKGTEREIWETVVRYIEVKGGLKMIAISFLLLIHKTRRV